MADIIIVFATVVIAIFSALTWFVSRRIHQSTQKRDKEIKDILKNLTAATLVTPIGVEKEEIIVRSFKKMLKTLNGLEKE